MRGSSDMSTRACTFRSSGMKICFVSRNRRKNWLNNACSTALQVSRSEAKSVAPKNEAIWPDISRGKPKRRQASCLSMVKVVVAVDTSRGPGSSWRKFKGTALIYKHGR